ncbi:MULTISPECIES: YtxH domain-containing protein [Mammaliicoccus]|jgi:gas vesicle protein|uniref:YtxH domain-containing protein n=1 Tax=Mammaliicoccus lentus TaxID=42858 RepID=A0AAX3W1V6_MAMLE|nr:MULTISPECIES: YtxH domain-containing protein [Mammaliicoccus]HBV02714.1 YtxH domain-containing protein [Staphylococcus sp.]MBF0750080.1 YtxH domain-containing protein [Mammaliicoccus lentus]MBF0793637.1 YtxH domain-containing protein [Mammaliicoccus lentus]MBU6113805.1 YtxH domain-containing protein [Mammaliicoccus lentus]MBW0761988.1 YtxH domain-containing protein [Mammaliicoccus lentus]
MAKKAGLFRTLVVLGGTAAAVVLSKKENRDKLKNEYDKYKEDPENYKASAKEKASEIKDKAQNEYSKYKEDPESYKEKAKTELKKAKENPKGYASDAKSRLKKDDSDNTDLREAKFDDEGGTANGNLRIVTEEDLKK